MRCFVFLVFLSLILLSSFVSAELYFDNSYFSVPSDLVGTSSGIEGKYSKSSQVSLDFNGDISSILLTADVRLDSVESYARVLAVDSEGSEFLVFGSDLNSGRFRVEKVCEETCNLEGKKIESIKFEIKDALLNVQDLSVLGSGSVKGSNLFSSEKYRSNQEELKVEEWNTIIESNEMYWVAGKTSVSGLSYFEKKRLLGVEELPNLFGFEYYSGGLFEIPSSGSVAFSPETSHGFFEKIKSWFAVEEDVVYSPGSFPDSWDWRDRHGENWVTPVKSQGSCGSCSLFAATATAELYVNLYSNERMDLDLSEQKFLSCMGGSGCFGGIFLESVGDYLEANSFTTEDCFPYVGVDSSGCDYHGCGYSPVPCSAGCGVPSESVNFGEFVQYDVSSAPDIKMGIISKGGVAVSIFSWIHSMMLEGYGLVTEDLEAYIVGSGSSIPWEIPADSDLIGRDYWIFKNSWGTGWGDDGYGYIVFEEGILSDLLGPVFIFDGPVTVGSQLVEISCYDKDNDGFCNWGISESMPSSCPGICQGRPRDCDDSDPSLRAMYPSGNCISVAVPECSDGIDNDNDGLVDYAEDFGCDNPQDWSEANGGQGPCRDGIDNDNDGAIDEYDVDCNSRWWYSENPDCSDGIDNDNDGVIDYPWDVGCSSRTDSDEGDVLAQCQDGFDNDNDGLIDLEDDGCHGSSQYPSEVAMCQDGLDNDYDGAVDLDDFSCQNDPNGNEINPRPECNDFIDNDDDGRIDMADPNCLNRQDNDEALPEFECFDNMDNDGDGLVDMRDPGCNSLGDNDESDGTSQCQDGIDNDNDGAVDYPRDFSCSSPTDNDESVPQTQCQDGLDNDNDLLIDMEDDGCMYPQDDLEYVWENNLNIVEATLTVDDVSYDLLDGASRRYIPAEFGDEARLRVRYRNDFLESESPYLQFGRAHFRIENPWTSENVFSAISDIPSISAQAEQVVEENFAFDDDETVYDVFFYVWAEDSFHSPPGPEFHQDMLRFVLGVGDLMECEDMMDNNGNGYCDFRGSLCRAGLSGDPYCDSENDDVEDLVCDVSEGCSIYRTEEDCVYNVCGFEFESREDACVWTSAGRCESGTAPCFLEGTEILMADGSSKFIEDVEVGDLIASYDLDLGEEVVGEVVETFYHPDSATSVVDLDGLMATMNHPIYVGGNWVVAEDVEVGDLLFGLDDLLHEVSAVDVLEGLFTTYNLEVEPENNYFADGFLVHNKAPPETCFVEGLKVLTPSGSVLIEDLVVGDWVMSRNLETGEFESTEIVKFNEHSASSYLVVNDWLKVTPNHPMVVNGEWVEIGSAVIGDELEGVGNPVEIYSIESVVGDVNVYDLEVEKNHNYFVGGLLAHNGAEVSGDEFAQAVEKRTDLRDDSSSSSGDSSSELSDGVRFSPVEEKGIFWKFLDEVVGKFRNS